jgi:hypothetical protein
MDRPAGSSRKLPDQPLPEVCEAPLIAEEGLTTNLDDEIPGAKAGHTEGTIRLYAGHTNRDLARNRRQSRRHRNLCALDAE